MIPLSFFFSFFARDTSLPRIVFSRGLKSWALLSATHALSRWNAMSVIRVGSTDPRHGFSSSYPSWAAYYGRVPISTRAIALLHRCMCAAPRLIAQVMDTIFVDLSIGSFLRAISREWDFLPVEILCLFILFFWGRFFWILFLNFVGKDDERDKIFSISYGIIKFST